MSLLSVKNVGKAYRVYRSEWQRFGRWFGFPSKPLEENWVLRNISFDVRHGEAIGIVGKNGAGKSTLLKMITGTLQPSEGTVQVNGRIAAILELGMGFNPELTGHQNVIHAMGLMGFSMDAIKNAIPHIEAFADIGDYFKQSVRTYSSGMQARLAFSVATAIRPEILIVDEVLSVGDVFFQQKCFERIRKFQAEGTTLLFVSHSAASIYSLCTRAILISGGHLLVDDEPRIVIDQYNALMDSAQGHQPSQTEDSATAENLPTDGFHINQLIPLTGREGSFQHIAVQVLKASMIQNRTEVTTLLNGQPATLQLILRFLEPLEDPHVGFRIHDARGEPAFMTNTHCMGELIGPAHAGDIVTIEYTLDMNLIPGEYTVTVGVANQGLGQGILRESIARITHAISFSMLADKNDPIWSGYCNLRPTLSVTRRNAS